MTKRLWKKIATGGVLAIATLIACRSVPAAAAPQPMIVRAPIDTESVQFASASGSTIHAWLVPGRAGMGAVLLLHGVGDDRHAMLDRARFLNALGFGILAPDFRGRGESAGSHTTYGALESLDALAALHFLRTTFPGERVGVLGVSMGGAAALLGRGPLDADAFVLESVYPTIRDAVTDRLRAWLGPARFVTPALTPVVLGLGSRMIGVTEGELSPIDRIAKVRAPLLLLAGTADRYTHIDEARALFARATSQKSMWEVTGADHEDLHAFAPAEYEARVGGFLVAQLAVSGLRAESLEPRGLVVRGPRD